MRFGFEVIQSQLGGGIEAHSVEKIISPSFLGYQDGLSWLLRALRIIRSLAFKLFAAIDLYSVNCVHVALYWSAVRAAEFVNYIGRNVVVALKSGMVELYQPYRWLRPCPVATQLETSWQLL